MAHADIALRAVHKHRKSLRANRLFQSLDSKRREITRDQKIVGAKNRWMTRVVNEDRLRVFSQIGHTNYSDLIINRFLIWAATINTDAGNVSDSDANLCGSALTPRVANRFFNSIC